VFKGLVIRLFHLPPYWLRRMKTVLTESLKAWIDQRAASKGAALAFYTLFSMTPILVLAIAVAGYFFGAEAAQGEIIIQRQGLVGPNGAQAIQALLAAAQDPASGLAATMIASVLLLVGTTSVFVELKGSLDELWGIKKSRQSGFSVLMRTRLRTGACAGFPAAQFAGGQRLACGARALHGRDLEQFRRRSLDTPVAVFVRGHRLPVRGHL
jgi:membrane protein